MPLVGSSKMRNSGSPTNAIARLREEKRRSEREGKKEEREREREREREGEERKQ